MAPENQDQIKKIAENSDGSAPQQNIIVVLGASDMKFPGETMG